MEKLDDSGDPRSRLWRITWWSMAWLAMMLPTWVYWGDISGDQALGFIQWLLPVVLGVFGGIKAAQKIAGAAVTKPPQE